MTAIDRFHAHLDRCQRCRDHPFDLCAFGVVLLQLAGNQAAAELSSSLASVLEGE